MKSHRNRTEKFPKIFIGHENEFNTLKRMVYRDQLVLDSVKLNFVYKSLIDEYRSKYLFTRGTFG